MSAVADILQESLPEFPEEELEVLEVEKMISLMKLDGGRNDREGGPFDDEDSRSFYEDLPNLRELVPAILLPGFKDEGNNDPEVYPLTTL
jgi:regulator of nonsense transcripts 2